jgi:hypothetical protein
MIGGGPFLINLTKKITKNMVELYAFTRNIHSKIA